MYIKNDIVILRMWNDIIDFDFTKYALMPSIHLL